MGALRAILLLALLGLGQARELQPESSALHSNPKPPVWPTSYSIKYILSQPYTAKLQPDMLSYEVTLHRDASGRDSRARLETLNGTNIMLGIAGDAEYEIVPVLDQQVCKVFPGGHGAASANALPSIVDWEYGGSEELNGKSALVWQYTSKKLAKTTIYKFYVDADGSPLRLHMIGQELTQGSHFAEYIVDYLELKPGQPDAALFEPPSLCDDAVRGMGTGTSSAGLRALALTPRVHYGGEDPAYDEFLTTHGHGRTHASLEEYRMRQGIFQKNLGMIEAHNAANKSFTMAMNKFGDWTREEFLSVMLPMHGKKRSQVELQKHHHLPKHQKPYKPHVDPKKVPSTVDWRGTGADTGVKDQSLCGSCWTFGAVGAMESAWFHATGESARFSEQQVMDCTWNYDPDNSLAAQGCDGGGAWAGIGHIIEAGGISLLKDYQYLGLTDYCREDSRAKTGKFSGYVRLPGGDDEALKEVVYTRGPVGISLDASQDSFTFYSSGVYYEPKCRHEYDDLDHAMILVGYGTDPAGDYWLVKNSWSDLWGDKGYIKVSMDNHGCGASTDALYAIVDDSAVAAATAH